MNVEAMALPSSINDHFFHLTFKCDLDFSPTRTNIINDTTTPEGDKLCQFILKSLHKCRSYGLDKLIYVTFKCDLDLQPTLKKSVSNGTFPPQGQKLCQIILKSIHKRRSYGPDRSGRTNGRTHAHFKKFVTAMSRFTATHRLPRKNQRDAAQPTLPNFLRGKK